MAIRSLVDTDVLIDIQRGHLGATEWFRSLQELPGVTGFVVMELIQDAQNSRQVIDVRKLVAPLPVVWPSEADCSRALLDFQSFHLPNGLGLLDALIASCAVGLNVPLLTFNNKHYRVVPGLITEQPYKK
jgi:predicted nucleic acid-binding protein